MSKIVEISLQDIIYHLKISCQIFGLAEAIATQKIIAETCESVRIKVELEELQQAADAVRLSNNLLKAEDTWSWLKKHHLSVDEFEDIAYKNILSNKLAIHLFGEKVEPFFYEHKIDYITAKIYQVILDDEDLAFELFYALQEGEINFAAIASQYSQDPEVRRAGGYQGVKRRQDLRADIAAAVFAANPPQIIQPIVTSQGVHLIQVEEIVQPELDNALRTKIIGDLFAVWLKEQISKVEIATSLENRNSQSVMKLVNSI